MNKDRGNAGLPNGFLNKLNDAGVVIESRETSTEKQYLMTRKELKFDEESKSITVEGIIGIGVAFPRETPVAEVARILSNSIPKMQQSRFEDDKIFTMFTYKE